VILYQSFESTCYLDLRSTPMSYTIV